MASLLQKVHAYSVSHPRTSHTYTPLHIFTHIFSKLLVCVFRTWDTNIFKATFDIFQIINLTLDYIALKIVEIEIS